jgi:hypothetical protein
MDVVPHRAKTWLFGANAPAFDCLGGCRECILPLCSQSTRIGTERRYLTALAGTVWSSA